MKQLNYQTLAAAGYEGYLLPAGTERVLQFGEGNFLRAFADYFVDLANERCGFDAKVVVCQPIADGQGETLNAQEGLYTLYLRGSEAGRRISDRRVISAISRCINPYQNWGALLDCAANPDLRYIVSNTTEAGIVYDPSCGPEDAPPASFPAKITLFLLERFHRFGGESGKGLVILSCELIDDNGAELRRCVQAYVRQWRLGEDFARWLDAENLFCSTLVDRIVTGYPAAEAEALHRENGYRDALLTAGEAFGLWVIEGPDRLREELPFERAGLPVLVCEDHRPYKQRKVRILNGAHTALVPAAYLAGQEMVRDCMEDAIFSEFVARAIDEEIIPALTLPREELEAFAASVCDRFRNPFIDHALLSIALNATSKWRARVLPSVREYCETHGAPPPLLNFSFAAHIAFCRGERTGDGFAGRRGGERYPIRDDDYVLDFFAEHAGDPVPALVRAVCGQERMWGGDLAVLPGFAEQVTRELERIDRLGMAEAVRRLLAGEA